MQILPCGQHKSRFLQLGAPRTLSIKAKGNGMQEGKRGAKSYCYYSAQVTGEGQGKIGSNADSTTLCPNQQLGSVQRNEEKHSQKLSFLQAQMRL